MKQQPTRKMAAYFVPVPEKIYGGNRVGQWKHPQRHHPLVALTARSAASFYCHKHK